MNLQKESLEPSGFKSTLKSSHKEVYVALLVLKEFDRKEIIYLLLGETVWVPVQQNSCPAQDVRSSELSKLRRALETC